MNSNTKKCSRVLAEMKEEIENFYIKKKKEKAKVKKTIDIKEIHTQLHGTI